MMIKIALMLISLQFLAACNQNDMSNKMISISPKNEADIVYFYKKDVPSEQQLNFNQRELYESLTANKQRLGDGILTWYQVRNNGYEGGAINFKGTVTSEQLDKITEIISHSPLVYKFYTNVVPSEIKDLK